MSDYFFYDLNKKMADLADKQQLRESAVPASAPKSKLTENFDADYLQRVVNGKVARPLISKEKAMELLQQQTTAQPTAAVVTSAPAAAPDQQGFNADYLQRVVNGKVARPLISKEKAMELLQQQTTNEQVMAEGVANYSAKKAAAGKDIGKPGKNFSKIAADAAKRYGSAKAGKRVAGAVLNKLRHPTEESVDESAFQAAIGKKKYGEKGMEALQKAGRNHASDSTMKKIRNQYDKYDESVTDEGNAFSKAVVDAKRDGIQPGEKIQVGGKKYPVREQGVAEESSENKYSNLSNRGVNRGINRAADDFDRMMDLDQVESPHYKKQHQQDTKQRLKTKPMAGPKGVLPEQNMSPMSPDGATAPPAKGKDGQYPVVTSGPNKGKRWSPNTPGPTNPAMKEAAKYRASKYKDKLYTQEPGDSDDYDSISYGYDIPERPKNDPGQKRRMGGVGNEFSITDPLEKGFGRGGAANSINTHGRRKGLPSRDQITGLKQSIRDVLGKHTEPNLPEGGVPMTPKQQRFAKLAPPVDKITFADKIVGAKKEVDEMLGDVAANAMKKAVRGRNHDMEESSLYDTPTRRRSSSGGEIDTAEPGVTRHRAGRSYSGAGHDVGADDDTPRSGQAGRRKVGAGMGTKIGAKINTGKSKLMTREGDMDPADQGEYDQEGEMAKDSIQTVVRHAMALEKILGDNDNLPEWVQSKLAKIESMMTAVDDYMQNQQDDEMKMNEKATNKRAGRQVAKDIEYNESETPPDPAAARAARSSMAQSMANTTAPTLSKESAHDKKKEKSKLGKEESTNTRDSHAEKAGKKVARDIEYDEKEKDGIHGQRRGSEDNKAERAGRKVTKDIEYDEKKDKKKKEVDETTSSGSVATGGSAPKSGGSVSYGKGIYDSLNREVEKMISESMSINMSMNNDSHGGPAKTLTVTATDEDAMQLAMLLKSAGIGSQDHGDDMHSMTDNDSEMYAIHNMDSDHSNETCSSCGCSDCECDEMNEAYGDTDATDNEPDYPTDEVGTDDAMMYSGGLNGPKSTGQTTIPVISGQRDRMGYEGDHELRRMMEIAGISR